MGRVGLGWTLAPKKEPMRGRIDEEGLPLGGGAYPVSGQEELEVAVLALCLREPHLELLCRHLHVDLGVVPDRAVHWSGLG